MTYGTSYIYSWLLASDERGYVMPPAYVIDWFSYSPFDESIYDSWYNNMYTYMTNPNPDAVSRFDARYKELLDSGIDSKTAYDKIVLYLNSTVRGG